MLRITQLDSGGDNLLNMAGEIRLYSGGDKLPESTGEDDSTLLGKLLRTGLHWGYLVFYRGTILYFVDEY